ncbi:3-keto-5-aminohexanoate cleavage protein [Roseibium sp. RKSG952]|nr:3-keto-5-aminohexanoate cleavage protein [Roseibium sp. RKSG952]
MPPLPKIMVAPNGARRTKADHPALPLTVSETVDAALACFEAGADGLHAHVRDKTGAHVLDPVLYLDLLSEMNAAVPQMQVQITTEAVGKYSPRDQRQLVRDVVPQSVSISVAEMLSDGDLVRASAFYGWARETGIAVQHILYSSDDLTRLSELIASKAVPGTDHQILFVLGRYKDNQESAPSDLEPFLEELEKTRDSWAADWAVCAFGRRETDCLVEAVKRGGKARIGFENGLWNRDGSLARDNADRVRDLVSALN